MAAEPHILIVDDDAEICLLVRQFLEPHGFRVTAASDGNSMRAALVEEPADLVILDLMLPGDDGLTLCRELRATTRVPIIFLTALNSEADRVVGLEMGADDYFVDFLLAWTKAGRSNIAVNELCCSHMDFLNSSILLSLNPLVRRTQRKALPTPVDILRSSESL